LREQLGVSNQAFALEQPRQLCQAPCSAIQAAAQQAGLAPGQVERIALLGGFSLVEAAHAHIHDALRVQYRPAHGCNPDIQAKDVLRHGVPLVILSPDCGYPG
jgi:hypothetical protein